MASGDTKTEAMLNALGNGGSGDEFRGCCNTKTQQYILDAIDRVQNVEDEVEELKNNPDVVDIVDTYADLQAYDTQHLTENDIVRVLEDETHSGNSTYYRFTKNPDTWTFIGEISGGGGEDSVNSLFLNKGSGNREYLITADSDEEKQLCKIINDYISGTNKNFLISFANDSAEVAHTSVSIHAIVPSSSNVMISFNVESDNLPSNSSRNYGISYKNLNYYSLTVYAPREEYDANNIQHVFSNAGLTNRTFTLSSNSGANAWAISEDSLSIGPLGTTNTSSYTPTQDYHPATKKYVDTAVASVAANTISSQDWSNLWQ